MDTVTFPCGLFYSMPRTQTAGVRKKNEKSMKHIIVLNNRLETERKDPGPVL